MTRLFAGTQWDQPPRCDRCGALETDCTCPPPPPEYASPATLSPKIAVEKRKGGKTVTVIRGLPADKVDVVSLLTQLKNHCGAGGTVREESLEIQGDHAKKIEKFLKEAGFRMTR